LRVRAFASPMAILVLTVLFCVVCRGSFFALAVYESSMKIEAADSAVRNAFVAVLDVEKVGGNVSGLMSELDGAGRLLAEANNAYRSGDLSGAEAKAENVRLIAESVRSEALELKSVAESQSQRAFWFTIVFSVAGSAVFVGVLILVWNKFKRGYAKRLMGMKPEVAADAEA